MSQPIQPQQYPPQQPQPSPFPPIPQKTKKPWFKRWWAIVLFIVVGLLALSALINPGGETTPTTAVPGPTVTVTATETVAADDPAPTEAEPEPEPTKAPAAFNPKPKDFTVGIKILTKECFGSAGCNLTYRIVPKYVSPAPIPSDAIVDVTYAVSGAEDPIVGTFTVEDGKAQYNEEESASTSSSAKKLSAKVTEVSVQ